MREDAAHVARGLLSYTGTRWHVGGVLSTTGTASELLLLLHLASPGGGGGGKWQKVQDVRTWLLIAVQWVIMECMYH